MKAGKWYFTVMLCAALSAVFFIGGVAYGAVSPVGSWDFTVSGAKLGSAMFNFYLPTVDPTDGITPIPGAIDGYVIVIPAPHNMGGPDHVSEFGCVRLTGQWEFDGNQVVGYLYSDASDQSFRLDITTFRGTVAAGRKSFAFTGETDDGNVTLSGAPLETYNPIPSTWTIKKTTQGNVMFTEIVKATPFWGNLYSFSGEGADLCVYGYGALSRGNNFDVSLEEFPMPKDGSGCPQYGTALDQSTRVGSAAIGKLDLGTHRSTTLVGAQDGTMPGHRVTMHVLCQ